MRKAGLAIFLVFAIGSAARADEVTAWNKTLFRSGVVAGSSSQNMSRFAALVQTAVFDSVNGIERRYTPIHVAPAGPAGASNEPGSVRASAMRSSRKVRSSPIRASSPVTYHRPACATIPYACSVRSLRRPSRPV